MLTTPEQQIALLRQELTIIEGDQDPERYAKSRATLVASRERIASEYETKLSYIDARISDLDDRHSNGEALTEGIHKQIALMRDKQLGPTIAQLLAVTKKIQELSK